MGSNCKQQTQAPILTERCTNFIFTTPQKLDQGESLGKSLRETINAAYKEQSSRTKVLDENERIIKRTSFEMLLGNDPSTFCILQKHQLNDNSLFVTGTISANRVLRTTNISLPSSKREDELTVRDLFSTKAIPEKHVNSIIWELQLLAVHPSVQKQGLGSKLIEKVEVEIRKRTLQTNPKAKKVVIILKTVKEHAGPFYIKLGYSIQAQNEFPAGIAQSENPFTILHMYKEIMNL